MKLAEDLDQDRSFEEDIAPPFRKVYSYSSNTAVSGDREFTTLGDIAVIHPGLGKLAGRAYQAYLAMHRQLAGSQAHYQERLCLQAVAIARACPGFR